MSDEATDGEVRRSGREITGDFTVSGVAGFY